MIANVRGWGLSRERPPALGLLCLFLSEWELLQEMQIGGPVALRDAAPSTRRDLVFLEAILLLRLDHGLYSLTERGHRLLRSWPIAQTDACVSFDVSSGIL